MGSSVLGVEECQKEVKLIIRCSNAAMCSAIAILYLELPARLLCMVNHICTSIHIYYYITILIPEHSAYMHADGQILTAVQFITAIRALLGPITTLVGVNTMSIAACPPMTC